MKTIYIIRHAKAEDHSLLKRDYNRDLIEKGKSRAAIVASKLKEELTIDDKTLVISSSANRAIQTAQIFCDTLNYPAEKITQTQDIYESSFLDILKIINKVPDHIETLLIFGHNPGLSDLTNYICNSYISLKTAEISKINIDSNLNFSEISGGTGYLEKLISE